MRPTLAAEELKTNLTQYLTTTFALADPPVREALEQFLNDPANGIFRGPYLRIRTPFRRADEGLAGHPGVGAGRARSVPAPGAGVAAAVEPGPRAAADAGDDRHRVGEDRGVPHPGPRPLPPRARRRAGGA